jgi:hypothetical protein
MMNLNEFVKASKELGTPGPGTATQWTVLEQKFWDEHKYAINEALSPEMREHVWEEGVGLYVWRTKMLPTAEDLSIEMFDEWDDPVSVEDAKLYLTILKRVAGPESA